MKTRQKLVLGLLAGVDLAVVAILGTVAYQQMRKSLAPQTAIVMPQWPCSDQLAQPLETGITPALGWTEAQLTVEMTVRSTDADTHTVQLLWPMLDRLKQAHLEGCTLPPEVTVTLNAETPTHTERHTATLETSALGRWAAGTTTDDAFAALVRYAVRTESSPSTPQADPSERQ